MKPFFAVLLVFLSVATGALFLYSAYSKAFPVYGFEATIVEYVHLPYAAAAIISRLFIGIEAAIGTLLLLNIYGARKWVLKSAILLIVIFSGYLLYIWARFGADVNCGCFGDAIWMNAPVSLLKNAFILASLFLLVKYNAGLRGRWVSVALGSVACSLLVIPFILFPPPVDTSSHIDLTPLYNGTSGGQAPVEDIRKGRHIIAFLSPSCSHCRKAALKMHDIHKIYPSVSFFLVIGGTTSDLTDFWAQSHAEDLPHTRMDKDLFLKYTGGVFPVILWVNNGRVEAKVGYRDMDATTVNNWMKK